MDVEQRVHIVPVGFEYDRVFDPIERQRADVAYLLVSEDDGAVPSYFDDLRSAVESVVRDVSVIETDFTDVYAVLGDVTTLAASHEGDNVYVNVSGAGTIPAIGATIACMDVSTDATAYHVEPETTAYDGIDRPITSGVSETTEIPIYPIDSPSRDQIAIMDFLADPAAHDDRFETTHPKKKDVIAYARDTELSFLSDRSPSTEKGAFRLLDTHVVKPLEIDGYVTVEQVGRRRLVHLTDRGVNALRAFRHKLEYGDS
ncbi:DUF6293 family protein [Halovivax gelatinilyticus]|uniref:HFX_2341 family transcriptional regulator domain-containing protein n=1 Tax=Halovivax gelatinilyticus TaxID=2961597 RepID=UPI0020CA3CDF|nr:DUF6293 family protein [Halovivax gelatinilyticus]